MTSQFIAVKGENHSVLADFIAISINSAGFNTQKWVVDEENNSYSAIRLSKEPIRSRTMSADIGVDFLVYNGNPNAEDLKICNEQAQIISLGEKKLKNAIITKNKLKSFILNVEPTQLSEILGAFVKVFKQISLKNAKIAIDILNKGSKTAVEEGYRGVK